MTSRHVSTRIIVPALLVLIAVSAAAQARKPSPGQEGGLQPTQPVVPAEFLPDLVVASAKATATCTAKGSVTAKIEATVKNQSPKGPADLTKVPWQIVVEVTKWWSTSGEGPLDPTKGSVKTVKPQQGGPKVLKPGESWTTVLEIANMPPFKTGLQNPGTYGFTVRADPLKGIGESNEANNDLIVYAKDPCFKS